MEDNYIKKRITLQVLQQARITMLYVDKSA